MRLLASAGPGEVRVAAADADGLHDYAIWRPGAPDGVGDVHRGRVTARVPALAGAFVALAGGEGFLPDSAGGAEAGEGQILAVRITRAAQGGKGPRLAAAADVEAGRGAPALLARGPDAVRRLAALHPTAPVLADDAALVAALRPALGAARVSLTGRAFDEETEAEVAALAEPQCDLPGGLRLGIYPTPALTALDVDLAAAAGVRGGKGAVHIEKNRAALPQIARQIRLRNLSGAIVLDLAGLSPRRRAALAPDLAAALGSDPLRPRFLGFSALGLAEILRPRVHPPLHELLAGPEAAGLAALRHLAREIAVRPGRAPVLAASPAVVAALQRDQEAMADLARRAGRPLMLRPDPTLVPLGWRIEE